MPVVLKPENVINKMFYRLSFGNKRKSETVNLLKNLIYEINDKNTE
jgi:hypothetical protein